jgi:ribosomal protein S18 acetylase RimI-like enzyme
MIGFMPITYSIQKPITAQQLADVFRSSGIRRPVDDLPRMQQMIDRANLIATAWDDAKLVGVSRSLTDFCYVCYLSDLAVDRAYQRQGIGKELVRVTREAIGERTSLLLLAAPEAQEYYPKIGFEPLAPRRGWLINRKC